MTTDSERRIKEAEGNVTIGGLENFLPILPNHEWHLFKVYLRKNEDGCLEVYTDAQLYPEGKEIP